MFGAISLPHADCGPGTVLARLVVCLFALLSCPGWAAQVADKHVPALVYHANPDTSFAQVRAAFAAGQGEPVQERLILDGQDDWLWLTPAGERRYLLLGSPYIHTWEIRDPVDGALLGRGGRAWPRTRGFFHDPHQLVELPDSRPGSLLIRVHAEGRTVVPVQLFDRAEAGAASAGKQFGDAILIGMVLLAAMFAGAVAGMARDTIFARLALALALWTLVYAALRGYDRLYVFPDLQTSITPTLHLLAIGAQAWFCHALLASDRTPRWLLRGLLALAVLAPFAILLKLWMSITNVAITAMYLLGGLSIAAAAFAAWRGDLGARYLIVGMLCLLFPQPLYTIYGEHAGILAVAVCGGLVMVLLAALQHFGERLSHAEAAMRQAAVHRSFLAMMSHEIRTPLNAIIGYAQLARSRPIGTDTGEALEQIHTASRLLLGIVDDLLDLAKLEENAVAVERVAVEPRGMIESVVSLFREKARDKGLALTCTFSADCPERIVIDPTRCSQIVMNLLSNAIKFTHVGSVSVTVSCEGDDTERLCIAIADTGIGIGESALAGIFEPFSQADASTTRRYGGTGLGLTICRRLARVLGGEIRAVSTVGVGSTFTLELPCERSMAAVAPAGHPPFVVAPDGDTAQLDGLDLIVAEDNRVNQLLMRRILEGSGVVVRLAADGEAAVRLYCERVPDLVLMDMQMPGVDGPEATRRIRALDLPQVPVIAITANASIEDQAECRAAGMDDFLSKPIDAPVLLRRIETWAGAAARSGEQLRRVAAVSS